MATHLLPASSPREVRIVRYDHGIALRVGSLGEAAKGRSDQQGYEPATASDLQQSFDGHERYPRRLTDYEFSGGTRRGC